MGNITLSIEEEVLTTVRDYAAESGTTVDAIVQDYLRDLANKKARIRQARRRIRELSESSTSKPFIENLL